MDKKIDRKIKYLKQEAKLGNQEAMLELANIMYPLKGSFSDFLENTYHEGYNDAKACKLNKYGFGDVKVGDIIKFGSYQQITDDKEPIKWKILKIENKKALIISQYSLEYKAYNEKREATSWEKCSLRRWLNNEFMKSAFSEDEQNIIQLSKIEADINPRYKSSQGSNTEDKVFLLSIKEVEKYFEGNVDRHCIATKYVVKDRSFPNGYMYYWWLRSLGYDRRHDCATIVWGNGSINFTGLCVNNLGCVRPALWINLTT